MNTIKTNTSTKTNVIKKWQSSKKTIKERFNFLFNNENLSDIHFIVGKNKQHRIPAHKLVLAAASDVFEAMFYGSLATEFDQVELPDIEPTIFLVFLKFIYTDKTKIDHETVMSTLYVAKKYNVTALKNYCVNYLETNLDSDNAVLLLKQARFFDEPKLANICLSFISLSSEKLLASGEFLDIDLYSLTKLLKKSTLHNESILYEVIIRWTKAECVRKQLDVTPENQRFVLGPAIKLIPFSLMSIEDFTIGPVQIGLLTDRKEQILKRFKINSVDLSFRSNESIDFMADRPIFLVGFGFHGSQDVSVVFNVNLELIHKDTSTVCGSIQTSFNSNDLTQSYKVRFNEPIKITPNTYYKASVRITTGTEHVWCWYGFDERSKVIINDLNGKPITFKFASTGDGGTVVGQIPEIIFNA